jgi:hypothetical protein
MLIPKCLIFSCIVSFFVKIGPHVSNYAYSIHLNTTRKYGFAFLIGFKVFEIMDNKKPEIAFKL